MVTEEIFIFCFQYFEIKLIKKKKIVNMFLFTTNVSDFYKTTLVFRRTNSL